MKSGWTVLLLLAAAVLGVIAFAWLRVGEGESGFPAASPGPSPEERAEPAVEPALAREKRRVEAAAAEVEARPAQRERANAAETSGTRLAGVVVWPDDAPAAGAEVLVRSQAYPAGPARGATQRWKQDERAVRANAAGAFEVDGLGPGPFALRTRLKKEGERWYRVALDVPAGSQRLRLVLRPPVRLAGVVIDDGGRPVVPAEITLAPGPGPLDRARFQTRTTVVTESATGAFVFPDLVAGPYELRAEAEEHGRSLPLRVAADESHTNLVLELERASAIGGFVLDPDGAAVPGALVACVSGSSASPEMWDLGEVQQDCRADGSFQLVDLPPGPVTLRAYHVDWATSDDVHLELQPGQHWPGVNVSLRRGGRLTGRVLDDYGRPVTGASVAAESSDAESSRDTYTDGSGAFVFERLTPGELQVVARWEGADAAFENLRLAAATIVAGATAHVVLGGAGGVHLSGRVTAGGEPVPAARVIALGEGSDTLNAARMDRCDAGGVYELVLPRAGRVTFAVWRAEGGGSAAEFHATIPDEPAAQLDFELPEGSIAVTVLAPDGGPATYVPIAIARDRSPLTATNLFFAPDQRTDGHGRHTFGMLSPGRYTVRAGGEDQDGRVHSGRWGRGGIAVDGAPVKVTLQLPPAAEVAGVVLDEGGRPYPGARVYVRDGIGRVVDPFPSCYTDAAGRFHYRAVRHGGVSVFARTEDRAASESVPISVEAGEVGEVELRLSRATLLRVTPVDAEGAPVVAAVSVTDAIGRELAGLLATNDVEQVLQAGISTVEHVVGPLPPGTYRVEAAVDGRRAVRAVVLDGRQREQQLALELN